MAGLTGEDRGLVGWCQQLAKRGRLMVLAEFGEDVVGQRSHFSLCVSGVSGERELAHRRAHGPSPVADGYRAKRPVVQDCEVAWKSADPSGPQGAEASGDRSAHQLQQLGVAGHSPRIGLAAIQGRGDAGDEHA